MNDGGIDCRAAVEMRSMEYEEFLDDLLNDTMQHVHTLYALCLVRSSIPPETIVALVDANAIWKNRKAELKMMRKRNSILMAKT